MVDPRKIRVDVYGLGDAGRGVEVEGVGLAELRLGDIGVEDVQGSGMQSAGGEDVIRKGNPGVGIENDGRIAKRGAASDWRWTKKLGEVATAEGVEAKVGVLHTGDPVQAGTSC